MQTVSDIRRILGRLILVLFIVVHAPVSGVMTAAPVLAHGSPTSAGLMVICLDGQYKQIDVPGGPTPTSTGGQECLCPCATLAAKGVLEARPSPDVLVLQDIAARQVHWTAETGPIPTPPPQTGRGSPRSPPFSSI